GWNVLRFEVRYNTSASVDWRKDPDRGLPCPDVIFYFHLSSEEGLKRSGYGEERYEKKSFQECIIGPERFHQYQYSISINVSMVEMKGR
uniref:Uncharacterized protein n=1 Tax=Amphimedon queenslandica TaxID=400682 RepID=A0A1X7TPP1_AMPQE